jgi:hypothetical protein
MNMAKIQRLERREKCLRWRIARGHSNPAVVTRWKRELLRTRAAILALQSGRHAGDWTEYKEQAREELRLSSE